MKYALISTPAYLYGIQSSKITGGNAKQEWLLAKALAQRGHDVVVIVPSNDPLEADSIDGVRLVRSAGRWPAFFYALIALHAEHPDWFHVMGATPHLLVEALMSHLWGFRCVWAFASDRQANPRTAFGRSYPQWPLFALGLKFVDRIFAQHAGQRDMLDPALQSKTSVVNNFIEAVPAAKPAKPYISWIGWLIQRKRPHLLIEIARALPEVTFVVGGPCEKTGLEADYGQSVIEQFKAVPNIDYRGFVERDATQRLIAGSSLFLSTSNHEGLPNTFLEAWISGVPTVSLELDPGDIMATHHTGVVVHSVDELIRSISVLLSNADELAALGKNACRYVEEFHSSDYICRQIETALGVKPVTRPPDAVVTRSPLPKEVIASFDNPA